MSGRAGLAAGVTRRLIVTGQVQGVGYRDWAVKAARGLHLSGWVRNRRDGSVEIVAAGDPGAVDRLFEQCRTGPPAARVDRVTDTGCKEEVRPGFERRPTA